MTARMGELSVVGGFEAIAGDTVQIQNMGVIRVSPPNTPVMHPVTIKFFNFFVPNRILNPADGSFEWEKFITGGEDGTYITPPPSVTATIAKGSIMEGFGLTPGDRTYNTFLAKGYAKIWNEYFRDQQLQAEIDVDTFDGTGDPLKVAWERDYFTAARPDSSLGPEIILPIGQSAPVTIDTGTVGANGAIQWRGVNDGTIMGMTSQHDSANDRYTPGTQPINQGVEYSSGISVTGATGTADLSSATGISVNELRESMALQRYQEARNMYGSRFTEYLRYLGISSSDGRLQRPELISTGKSSINFSEVLNTASDPAGTTLDPLGKLGGHGIAGVRSRKARYFCEEHGHIITVMYTRPKTMYLNTQHKMFNRETKEDYWQKELQAIGMEEIQAREIFADAVDPTATFGFTDRYSSFARVPSRVSGDFRDTLNTWHLGRDLGQEPVLNAAFIECDPSDRIYADTDPANDKLWCTIKNRIAVRSLLRKGSANRIL